ncbi:hypothetical protein HanHA300_Chr09g0304061 [Helianthus annuus]|nr:hypothetical protein HanHA300_Chr09g0304061 [Helianthus annuus]KAJ0541050.1 hypothetical protein HanHA89_Chr09g0324061 [Helianthus annuus]KAJ0706137.1 hypothetical protein HanLR1_Chr09g0303611 [Helianthus annuus]
MSRSGRSAIRSVLTAKDLKSFVETYNIHEQFSPSLSGPNELAECTPDMIPLYTLAFSSCGVRYPLSPFKVALLPQFGVHFSQLHPLGFMRLVHFVLSCAAVSGEPSIPLFCMFYKLISDGDWFTFSKRQNSVSKPCYSFMPTSTYPKDWKSRFIFVSATMMPESPLPRDVEAVIEDVVSTLSTAETVQWKRMYENPTRAFTFFRGDARHGGLSPSYPVCPKAFFCCAVIFSAFSCTELTLWRLLQGYRGVNPGWGFCRHGVDEGTPSDEEESSLDPPLVQHSDQSDDEALEVCLFRKRKAASPKPTPTPRDIRQRLRSASGQKPPPLSKVVSDLPPVGVKGSLSKHLRSSSLVSAPLLGSSQDPIEIPTGPSSSRVQDKTSEVGITRFSSVFELSPSHAMGTSKPTRLEGPIHRSLLAPMFADAIPHTYVPNWKISHSSVIGTPESARDFLTHVVPPSH